MDRYYPQAFYYTGLGGVIGWNQEAFLLLCARPQSNLQNAFHRTDGAGQSQFAHHDEIFDLVRLALVACGEQSHRDGEIEAGSLFSYVGGGEVNRGSTHRILEA